MPDQHQYRYAYPKYRVFIFGVEVSTSVLAVNISHHDGNAPSTCQITLENEFDKFITTTKDLAVLTGRDPNSLQIPWLNPASQTTGQTTGIANSTGTSFNGLTADNPDLQSAINSNIVSATKRQILLRKLSIVQQFTQPRQDQYGQTTTGQTNFTNYFGQTIKKYPLSDGLPIFHVMDPVRVFMCDPYNPARWYHMFAGFVSDMVDNTDQNNTKTLTITVEDVTKLFRYTRVVVNPGITDANLIVQNADLSTITFNQNFLHNYSLPEIFFTLLFGPTRIQEAAQAADAVPDDVVGPYTTEQESLRLRGIGHFSFNGSAIFTYGPPPSQVSSQDRVISQLSSTVGEIHLSTEGGLQDWQMLIDHEVQPSDLYTMATDNDKQDTTVLLGRVSIKSGSDGLLSIPDVITYIGTHPEEYLIDGGRLMMLIPNSLGADNNNILTQDIIQSYPMQSSWISVGDILWETVDRIQFSMYASPRGDIIVEFPLFDFNPDDFGLAQIAPDKASNPIGSLNLFSSSLSSVPYDILSEGEAIFPGRQRGPFGSKYVILKRDTISWESVNTDEKVHTFCVTSPYIIQQYESIGSAALIGDLQIAKLPDLVPLYGVRMAQYTPRGYIASDKGAGLMANIQLNILNADAHNMKVDHTPNVALWLNRPIYIQGRNCIGTTKSVSHSIVWGMGGTMSTTTDLWAVRTWQGQYDVANPNKPIYTSIGGYGARPFDYSILMSVADVPAPSTTDGISQPITNDAAVNITNLTDQNDQLTNDINTLGDA